MNTYLAKLQEILMVIIAAILPYLELRGAIPLAWKLGFSAPEAFVFSVLGNMIPVIPIMLLVDPVSKWLSEKVPLLNKFFTWIFTKSKRHEAEIRKYGFWGLTIFVGIPLPMTGAWSGALIAFLMGMRKRVAFFSILFGVIIAGIIVTIITYGIANIISFINRM